MLILLCKQTIENNNLLSWGTFIKKGTTDPEGSFMMFSGNEIFKGKILDMSTKYSSYAAVVEVPEAAPKK